MLITIGIGGGIIGIIAIVTMKWNNLKIEPIPKQDAVLITSGIYHYIRHPMYLSVLLLMLSFVLNQLDMIAITMYIFLIITLYFKMIYEEQLLSKKFPSYQSYMEKSDRLILFIF